MFRVIGGAVVYGLALYGVAKLLDRSKMAVVIQQNGKMEDREPSADANAPSSQSDKEPQGQVGEVASQPSVATNSL